MRIPIVKSLRLIHHPQLERRIQHLGLIEHHYCWSCYPNDYFSLPRGGGKNEKNNFFLY